MALDEHQRPQLYCVTLDPLVEDVINGYIDRGPSGTTMSIPPGIANRIASSVSKAVESLVGAGHQLVLLTSPSVRAQVKQILDNHIPGAVVLSYNEIVRDLDVESFGLVQLSEEDIAHAGVA